MELLLFNEIHQITYFGKCKISVNSINKTLMVTPLEEDFKVCPHIFDQKIIKQNNLVCICASSFYLCDFILIFPSIETCNKIFDAIRKSKYTQDSTSKAIFKERFFLPILSGCQENETFSPRMKQFISDFLENISVEERKKYLNIIKEKGDDFYSEILAKIGHGSVDEDKNKSEKVVEDFSKDNKSVKKRQLRKRRRNQQTLPIQIVNDERDISEENYEREESEASFSDDDFEKEEGEITDSDCSDENELPTKKFKDLISTNIIEAPNFKLISYDEYGILRKKLIIFPVEDKTMCYVYGWDNTHKRFICWKCAEYRKELKECHRTAVVCKAEKKEDCVMLLQTKHFCKLIKYNPDNYGFDASKQIVHEPNFKIFKYEEFGIQKSKLVIFPSSGNQELCYEYSGYKGNYFQCNRCQKKRFVSAVLYWKKEENGQNYVKLTKAQHVCEMIKFDPEKYKFNEDERVVKAPNFKIDSYQQNGVQMKKLFIFTSLEKKMGYDYYFIKNFNKFCCCGCQSKKLCLTARICQDADGNDYVKISKTKHICELRTYGIQMNINYYTLYKPDYEIKEKTTYGKTLKKLYIIIQENMDLCYEFSYVASAENFLCYRCHEGGNKFNNIKAFICHDDEGREFIRVHDRPHLCQPLPYPVNYNEDKKIIRPPNYQFINRKVKGKLVEKLVTFANEEKTLCYEYTMCSKDLWRCMPCKYPLKKTVSAKLIKIDDNKEYIELGKNEHQCEPIKFDPEDAQINIVKKPNFMIENGRNKVNREIKRLTIFDKSDPNMCFYYSCILGDHLFRCTKCSLKKHYVSANIVRPKNDEEEYVVLGQNKHICQKEIYAPLINNLKIIKKPNFNIEKVKTSQGENERLMVKDWTNENNNLWYPYLWNPARNAYCCYNCKKLGKTVTAKLYRAENSEDDYIELSFIQHLCEPEPQEAK